MALTFNGTSTYLRTPYSAAMAVTGSAVTLCAWVKPAALTGEIVGRHHAMSGANSLYVLDLANGVPRMGIGAMGFLGLSYSTQRATGGTLALGRWYHVVGTYDGGAIRTYLNGVQVGSFTFGNAILTSTTPLMIGAHLNGTTPSNFLRGEIEDVRVYARALSANEVLTLYTVCGRDGMVQGLVSQYPLCGNFGQTLAANVPVQDISPGGYSTTSVVAGVQYASTLVSNRFGN